MGQRSGKHTWVKVALTRSGGQMPTLRPHIEIDLAQLPDTDRAALACLLDASAIASLPASYGAPVRADAFTYCLSASDTGASHSVQFSEGDAHAPALDALTS